MNSHPPPPTPLQKLPLWKILDLTQFPICSLFPPLTKHNNELFVNMNNSFCGLITMLKGSKMAGLGRLGKLTQNPLSTFEQSHSLCKQLFFGFILSKTIPNWDNCNKRQQSYEHLKPGGGGVVLLGQVFLGMCC